jgi:nicotinate (nicotinamide) nucleotide adenylyltransferase
MSVNKTRNLMKQTLIEQAQARYAIRKPASSKNIAIFGFSANPPTKNHLTFINHLTEHYDRVLVIPTNQSTLKKQEDYAPIASRIHMTEALLHDVHHQNKCELNRSEVDRAPPSRMVDTLSHLILQSTNINYTLALGFDAIRSFTTWYDWNALSQLCEVKFYPRPGSEGDITPTEMHEALRALFTPEPPHRPMNISLVFQSEKEKAPFDAILNQFIPLGLNVSIEDVAMRAGSATDIRAFYQAHRNQKHPGVTQDVHDIIHADACYQAPEEDVKFI